MSGKGKGPSRARAVAAEKLARQRAAERRRKALLGGVVAGVVLIAAVIIGLAVYNSQKPETVTEPKGGDRVGITVGQASAKATVDLYIDYICPHCNRFESSVGPTLDKFVSDGKAKIVYHPIALLDANSTTNYSTRASAASACAADGGKFPEYTKALFAKQPPEGSAGLSDSELISIGGSVGAGDAFEKCVKDGKYKGWTANVTDAASKAAVNSTPTVMVNGKLIKEPTLESVTKAIEDAAAK